MTEELIIALYWKTDYHSIEDTKNSNTNVRARPDFTFSAVRYHSPSLSPNTLFTYIRYENAFTCKRISWDSGGIMFKKICFHFPILYLM